MSTTTWIVVILALALIVGGITTAWQAFSRPARIRSPEMRRLDERYFDGRISREDYLREKAELEKKEREGKGP